jgi:hypothetical protein
MQRQNLPQFRNLLNQQLLKQKKDVKKKIAPLKKAIITGAKQG